MLCGWEGKRRPTVMSMGSLYSPFVLVIIIWCKLCLWPGNNFKFTLTYDPRAWPLRLWLLPLALTLNDLKKITVELFNKSLLEPKKMTLYVVCRMHCQHCCCTLLVSASTTAWLWVFPAAVFKPCHTCYICSSCALLLARLMGQYCIVSLAGVCRYL